MSETKIPSRLIYAQRIFISDFLKCEKTAEFSEKISKKLKENINYLIYIFFFEAICHKIGHQLRYQTAFFYHNDCAAKAQHVSSKEEKYIDRIFHGNRERECLSQMLQLTRKSHDRSIGRSNIFTSERLCWKLVQKILLQ